MKNKTQSAKIDSEDSAGILRVHADVHECILTDAAITVDFGKLRDTITGVTTRRRLLLERMGRKVAAMVVVLW